MGKLPFNQKVLTESKVAEIDLKDFEATIYQPHIFKPKTTFFKTNNIIWIPKKVLLDMYAIAGLVKDEVSWLGTVDRDEFGFTITEVFLPEQTVSTAETEMTNAGVAKIGSELIERAPDASLVNKLRFWCHTHPFGGTSPSGPDTTQTSKLLKDVDDFFIRGICNKKGRMEFTLYLIQEGIEITDCPWREKIENLDVFLNHWLVKANASVTKQPKTIFLNYNENYYAGGYYKNNTFTRRVWCQKTFKWIEKEDEGDKEKWRIKYRCHLTDADFELANELEKKIAKEPGLPSLVSSFPDIREVSFVWGIDIEVSIGLFDKWATGQDSYGDLTFEEFSDILLQNNPDM